MTPSVRKYPQYFLFAGLLGLAACAVAQPLHSFEAPLKSSGTLPFYLDVCQFEGAAGHTRLEISYAIALPPPAGADSMTLRIDLTLSSPAGTIANLHEQKHFAVKADSPLTFIDLKTFEVPADTVALHLEVVEPGGGRQGQIKTRLPVRFFGPTLSLSDLHFVTSIHRPQGPGGEPFLRGGLVMLPNPLRTFGGQKHSGKAFFYFEVNHLTLPAEGKGSYNLRYTLSDLSGHVVLMEERPDLPIMQANTSRVEWFSLAEIPPGVYRLDLFLMEKVTGVTVSSNRYVTVLGGGSEEALTLPMTLADQERYLEQLRFIATREEISFFKELDSRGKQQFLMRFWQSKDPTPETPGNEFMVDYFSRLAESEKRFKGGLKSDMARIYLRYGVPLDIERRTSNARYSKPVEIWTYALNGSTQFVFVDRNNDGYWVLVHSNHPDEYSNREWEKEIQ